MQVKQPQSAAPAEICAADAQALAHMAKALEYIDNDATLTLLIGRQLELAIDSLWALLSQKSGSADLH